MACIVSLKHWGNWTSEKQKEMNVMSLKKQDKNIQQTPNTWPGRCISLFHLSTHSSLKPHQEWSQWKAACQEVILKDGKQEGKTEVC